MKSIRKKLLRWLLIGQLSAVILTASVSFFYVRNELEDLFDDRLKQLAYSVPIAGQYLQSSPPLNSIQDDDDDFTIQVWEKSGQLLLQLNSKEGNPALSEKEGFSTHLSKGMLWRSFVLKRDHWLIQVSQPFSDRLEMSFNVALGGTAPILFLIVFLGGLVWVSIGRGLQPLVKLTQTLDQRGPYTMSPLPTENLPSELRPLVEALNGLLDRLGNALEGQQKFVADAAHELRTPLAAVQLQAQLLKRTISEPDREQAVKQIRAGTIRASHLVQQLLTLARMEPDDWQCPFCLVDLNALVKSVIMDHTAAARERQIDLGVSREESLKIYGDKESLRVMLGNLIDNAIRYTPLGGQIDVALKKGEEMAYVEVEDNGPGIPVQEREQVFARFYRRPGTKEIGSGLGLAIVQEVVKHHEGKIFLDDGKGGIGLRVSVNLPINSNDSTYKNSNG